jgi:hypothetical protein
MVSKPICCIMKMSRAACLHQHKGPVQEPWTAFGQLAIGQCVCALAMSRHGGAASVPSVPIFPEWAGIARSHLHGPYAYFGRPSRAIPFRSREPRFLASLGSRTRAK